MPETLALTHSQRPYTTDSPLAYLLDLAARSARPGEDEQREDAVTAVAHHVTTATASPSRHPWRQSFAAREEER